MGQLPTGGANSLLMVESTLDAACFHQGNVGLPHEQTLPELLPVRLSYLGGILTPLSNCLRLLACLDTWISSSHDSGSCFLYAEDAFSTASQAMVT